MTNHMTRHMTNHMTRHVTRPRVAGPRGGGRVAVAVWRWPCGGHMTCHVTWQDNPLRVTGMAGVKEKPFKAAPNPLMYLARNIYRFYNGPSL